MAVDPFPIKPHNENADPFVVTPPQKCACNRHTTTPSTPKSTQLHRRFLEEVKMSPPTPTTPPRTPSRISKNDGQRQSEVLELGQNGFYFSLEIPQNKVTPKRAATPDAKAKERATPSPEKGTSRVKNILRKNLFGTPVKKTGALSGRAAGEEEIVHRTGEGKAGWLAHGADQTKTTSRNASHVLRSGSGSRIRSESEKREVSVAQTSLELGESITKEATSKNSAAPDSQGLHMSTQPSLSSLPLTSEIAMADSSTMPTNQRQTSTAGLPTNTTSCTTTTVPSVSAQKSTTISTPSNIGHLMAGLSNKRSEKQALPNTGSIESMPTPLRKMSARLGLKSPNVTRIGKNTEEMRDGLVMEPSRNNMAPSVPTSTSRNDTITESDTALRASLTKSNVQPIFTSKTALNAALEEAPHARLLRPAASPAPLVPSRPSTSTTRPLTVPSTHSKPGHLKRAQSFGTPARLRSSIQKDMYKVQESLKRSIGPNFIFAMPQTPMKDAANEIGSVIGDTKGRVKKVTRPISMMGPGKSSGSSKSYAVPRSPTDHKPRPKSMILDSAKIRGTIPAQVDSPRERAKLRSAAATPSSNRNRPTASRPITAASTLQRPAATVTRVQPISKSRSTFCKSQTTATRAIPPPKHVVPASAISSCPDEQKVASAEDLAGCVAEWHDEDRKQALPKILVCSAKPSSKGAPAPVTRRASTTPKPADVKADSGLGQSYTPPGSPTRLPPPVKSRSKTRLAVPTTPAQRKTTRPTKTPALNAAKLRTPLPAKTRANRHIGSRDPNALRTPSKEIESSLDRAIDAKIAEDARNGKEYTPSGNRINELLEARISRLY